MKTIKFRAIKTGTNAFVFGLPHRVYKDNGIDSMLLDDNSVEYIKNETLGQFVGQSDKDGKEIYEGDVIINPKATEPEDVGFTVVWRNSGFKFKTNFKIECEFEYLDLFSTSEFQVTGNIHQFSE